MGAAFFLILPSNVKSAGLNVWTYHNDQARTGLNPNETILTLSNVNSSTFGKVFANLVDGEIYGQPLYVSGVTVTGGPHNGEVHNAVFVATEHDSVYAFDADSAGVTLWHTSFLSSGVTTVPSPDSPYFTCTDITPEVGITDTPVIDLNAYALFLTAETMQVVGGVTTYLHTLHELDFRSGVSIVAPVTISASVPGVGDGGSSVTFGQFNMPEQFDRAGLLLWNGRVFTSWTSHCDLGVAHHGWMMAFDEGTLAPDGVFCVTPNGQSGSIWNCGGAPAVSSNLTDSDYGMIYTSTADGTYDGAVSQDWGDSVLRLNGNGGAAGLTVVDSFTPYNQYVLQVDDLDLGSGTVLLLPDTVGSATYPHLLIAGGKVGNIFLINRDGMGGYNAPTPGPTPVGSNLNLQTINPSVGTPYEYPIFTYFNGMFYVNFQGETAQPIQAFGINNAYINPTAASATTALFGNRGGGTSVSANGTSNGILWALQNGASSSLEILRAYRADNLAVELYNSSQVASRDSLGLGVKFTVPTIINGHVYVGSQNQLVVYGLLPPTPTPGSTTLISAFSQSPVIAEPNVINGGNTHVTFKSAQAGDTLQVSLYTLCGELVKRVQGSAGAGQCSWDAGGMASGIYFANVVYGPPNGTTQNKILKILIMH